MVTNFYAASNLLKARVYHFLRSTLRQEQRTALKKVFAGSRKRFRSALLLRYGSFTAEDLIRNWTQKLPRDWEVLMVHSAFDRLLPMFSGRPENLVDALMEFCGKDRTLLMPAFFLGGRKYDAVGYYKAHAFDARRTPSEMGLLSEIFRRKPGVRRSLHPTHSICATGPLAEMLTATHHLASTRTGARTPFEAMTQRRTVIAGLGVEYYRCLTQTHSAEDLMGDDFPIAFSKETIPVRGLDTEGQPYEFSLTVLRSDAPLDNTLLRSLLGPADLVEWKYRGAAMFYTYADRVTKALIDAAGKGLTVFGKVPPKTG